MYVYILKAIRILVSAKCDVNSFNLNHDTPLHITCAMGRRKLTKLLLEADAMPFQNLQYQTPLDIANKKNLQEIVNIIMNHKLNREKSKEYRQVIALNDKKFQLLSHINNKEEKEIPLHWSPYGCHYYPDARNFPAPKLESMPKQKLETFEQYYLDLAGNIRKG